MIVNFTLLDGIGIAGGVSGTGVVAPQDWDLT